ncbi:MAG: hypothetical protein AAGM84_06805 [Pseudomonadota bacterium]
MDVIAFEPDLLIGEDLRDAARAAGARARLVRHASNVPRALERAIGSMVLMLSASSVARHAAELEPVLTRKDVRVVLFGVDQDHPGGTAFSAVLPDPFTNFDVENALARLRSP